MHLFRSQSSRVLRVSCSAEVPINTFEALLRVVLFICLMLLVGLPVAYRTIVAPILSQANLSSIRLLMGLWRTQLIALIGLIIGAALLLYAQVIPLELDYTPAEWQVFITHASIGQMMLVRVGLGLLGLIALWLLRRTTAWLWVSVLIGLMGQATLSRTSHTYAMGANVLNTSVDFAHLVGGGLWAGGLIVLAQALATVQATATSSQQPTLTAQLIRRFSPLGMVGVALVVGSGLLLTPLHIAQPETLVNSQYGLLLTLKVIGVLLAMALAGWHKWRTQRNMRAVNDVQRFAGSLQLEIIVVLLVFVGAAFLTASPPPAHTMAGDMPHQMLMDSNSTFQISLRIGAALAALFAVVGLITERRH